MSTLWKSVRRLRFIMVSSVLVSTMGTACQPSSNATARPSRVDAKKALKEMQGEQDVASALNKLYQRYLTGSPEDAMTAMLEMDAWIPKLKKRAREQYRFWQHARLHCLSKALGNNDDAYLGFVKLQYWRLAIREAERTLATAEIARSLREFTEYECDRIVIEFDRTRTEGNGARFWRQLLTGPMTPGEWLKATYGKETVAEGN